MRMPVAAVSRSRFFSSSSSSSSSLSLCTYLLFLCGLKQEGGIHRMRVCTMAIPYVGKSSGRSSQLFTRCRSWWCCRQAPRGSQLLFLIISWSFLLLLLCIPSLARGANDMFREDGHARPVEGWHVDGKGTDIPNIPTHTSGRRYKHGERVAGRAGDEAFGKSPNESQKEGPDFTSEKDSMLVSDFLGRRQAPPTEGEVSGFQLDGSTEVGAEKSASGSLERAQIPGSLGRDCLKVTCSPVSGFDLKQPTLDKSPLVVPDLSTFQGPVSSAPKVSIIPPFLEWGSQPIFAPSIATLTIANTCNSTGLRIFQPFSTDMQFYTFGFQEKVLEPGERLSIPIVFLPRTVGMAEAMFIVQTSAGGFLVQAQGRGIGSPFKLQSLQGLRVASGETLQHTITLHNPFDEVLRVSNVYTWSSKPKESSFSDSTSDVTGSPCKEDSTHPTHCLQKSSSVGFESEEKSGRSINGGAAMIRLKPLELLEIKPHSSNSIAELEFMATDSDKYSGSVHIRLSRDLPGGEDILMLPVDVQVFKTRGDSLPVEPIPDVLEFGVITRKDQAITLTVTLSNPGTEVVQVEDMYQLLEDKNIVDIQVRKGLLISPGSKAEVAWVTYMGIEETVPMGLFDCHPSELLRDRKLIVQINSTVNAQVEVPYRALVFHGSMDCHHSHQLVALADSKVGEAEEFERGLESGSSNGRRVQFENGLSVPLTLFMDLDRRAWRREEHEADAFSALQKPFSVCCGEHARNQQSILAQTELLYPLVEIGMEAVRWVNVTNPSDQPVYMQVVIGSKAEACNYQCQGAKCWHEEPGDVIGSDSDIPDVWSFCQLDKTSNVFSLVEGGAAEMVVGAHSTAALGPVKFRPPGRCHWTSLLFIRNNLTQVEWVPLHGSGGSGSLTFLDGDYPVKALYLDFNITPFSPLLSGLIEEQVTGFLEVQNTKAICTKRVSRNFTAKNTGDTRLDVQVVELVGGGCSSHGFELDFCNGFTLAPGESAELSISYKPDFSAAVFQRDLHLFTSAGVVKIPLIANLPKHVFPLCAEMAPSAKYERVFLFLAIIALVLVLGVFLRMLLHEISMSHNETLTNGLKCGTPSKSGARQLTPVLFSSGNSMLLAKAGSTLAVSGRLRSSCGEPEVQSRTGDGTGASGPGRPKDNKGFVRSLKGIGAFAAAADSFVTTIGSALAPEDGKSSLSSPAGLPGIRVKIPNTVVMTTCKATGGSPPKEGASPSHAGFRKGIPEKKSQVSRGDCVHSKVAPEPVEEAVIPVKQPLLKSLPPTVLSVGNSTLLKLETEGENPPQVPVALSNTGVVGSCLVQSLRKGAQFRQVHSPKLQPVSPKSQPQSSSLGLQDKGKRKKRRSNVGIMKHEAASKGRSGSSSPSSSPASPATPASPSRPVSPLLHSDSQSNYLSSSPYPGSSPPSGFSSPKVVGSRVGSIAPLSRLDLEVDRRGGCSDTVRSPREPLSSPVYRRSESLSVDVASTALREMAQAKASDLSWSALSGKTTKSADKNREPSTGKRGSSKDWATVARKAVAGSLIVDKGEEFEDVGWDGRVWLSPKGSTGPALTPSATFPGRQERGSAWSFSSGMESDSDLTKVMSMEQGSGWSFPSGMENDNDLTKVLSMVPSSVMPPAARAPGAKIIKPFTGTSDQVFDGCGSGELGWSSLGEFNQEFSNSGKVLWEKTEGPSVFPPGLNSDGYYDIWGDHFGEITRGSSQQVGSGRPAGTFPRLPIVESTPSFFSLPSFPHVTAHSDIPLGCTTLAGFSPGFSVFSQAPPLGVVDTCLPSSLFNCPVSVSPQVMFPENNGGNFGPVRAGIIGQGLHSQHGHSLPGSPRPIPARTYSPPVSPSPMSAVDFGPLSMPETSGDTSCSYWSSSSFQEVFAAPNPIHLQS